VPEYSRSISKIIWDGIYVHEVEEAEFKADLIALRFNEQHVEALWKTIEKCLGQTANVELLSETDMTTSNQ
jgi:ketol-acid reductoisomerase